MLRRFDGLLQRKMKNPIFDLALVVPVFDDLGGVFVDDRYCELAEVFDLFWLQKCFRDK